MTSIFLKKYSMGRKGLFDLEKRFAFYGAYHSNPTNVFIHMLVVWPTLFTTLVLFYFTPPLISLPLTSAFDNVLILNAGFFFTLITSLFWVCSDKKAGSLAALLCFVCWVTSSYLASHLGFSLAWKVVLGTQLICWTGHVVGHRVFEKRAPVLQDNLSLAFLMEPFFIVLEALQMFFGYEPYSGFHAKVSPKIQEEIKEYQEKKRNKVY